jgi:hypothetical protein
MSEETVVAETTAAEPVVVQEGEVVNPESTPEATEQSEEAPKKKFWAHGRIDALTRQKHEAERTAEYWRKKAEETQPSNMDDLSFEDQIAARVRVESRKENAETASHTANQVRQEIFQARQLEARSRFADYDATIGNPSLMISEAAAEVIMESDKGPDVAYYLGKNPEEAARIYNLPPALQAKEIGRLEERISSPRSVSPPPPKPVDTVNGLRAGGVPDPSRMSMAEYVAARQAGKI